MATICLVGVVLICICCQIIVSGEYYIPMTRSLPMNPVNFSDDEWHKVLERIQPRIDNPDAQPIVQPPGAGKTSLAITPNIINGKDAVLGQFPWQLYVVMDETKMCGGSLILVDWALTAAHCVGINHRIILGTINLANKSEGYVRVNSSLVIKHEEFDRAALIHDIALLKLSSPVTLTANIKPIALPPMSDAYKTFGGVLATVSGFGDTVYDGPPNPYLKYTQLSVLEPSECVLSWPQIQASQLCAFTLNTTSCQGDSGGALFYLDSNNVATQLGIVSYGSTAGKCLGDPKVFARVTYYLGWISGKIGQDVSGSTTTTTTKAPTTTPAATTAFTGKTTKTTTPKPPNCAGSNFASMAKCCAAAPSSLVPFNTADKGDKADKACKVSSSTLKIFNTYTLNKQQDIKKINTIDFSSSTVKKNLGKDACFVTCYLDAKGVLIGGVNGEIDVTKLTDLLVLKQNSEWKKQITKIVGACNSAVSNITIPEFTSETKSCNGRAMIVLQCVQFAMVAACPSPKIDGNCKKDVPTFMKCAETIFLGLSDRVKSASMEIGTLPETNKVAAVQNGKKSFQGGRKEIQE